MAVAEGKKVYNLFYNRFFYARSSLPIFPGREIKYLPGRLIGIVRPAAIQQNKIVCNCIRQYDIYMKSVISARINQNIK